MSFLQVVDLTVTFGGLVAVNKVNFGVDHGDIFTVIGPNGAGKTTLFNAITGFQNKVGVINFKGEDISSWRTDQIAKRGIVRTFQHTTIFQGITVKEAVLTGTYKGNQASIWDILLRTNKFKVNEQRLLSKVDQVLEFTGITAFKDDYGRNLPYGAQRLVEIAIALAAEPVILLLDEPAAGLNSAEKRNLSNLIRKIQESGVTIILVEHDMPLVMGLSSSIMVVDHGEKIAEGKPDEIAHHPEVIRAYLGGAAC
ncbi:MAG: hypothetical protein APF81_16570 [Desulfosporosinus sp. BRH_c37]|nr:MAG: hypothetical protein APF81_16570 [Desulfosporosinus sp. BRH_c37]